MLADTTRQPVSCIHLSSSNHHNPSNRAANIYEYDDGVTGSCKIGEEKQGICWDRISGNAVEGTCKSRYCRSGWSCACSRRTHLCTMVNKTVNVIDDGIDDDTAACHEEVLLRPSSNEPLQLGSWRAEFSRKGMLANACNQISWYHNGEEMGTYGMDPLITTANIDTELARRSEHTKFEFKPGDLIAFRFKNASYYCYNHRSVFLVNGTMIDTSTSGAQTWFAKTFSPNWFSPSFVPTYASDEASAGRYDFIPLRTAIANSDGTVAIVPGTDLWEPDDGSFDHQTSNFYFRIQL